jgi:hypothetical protein
MSKADTAGGPRPALSPSPQYLDWLRRERRDRIMVRVSQLGLLAVLLVLWEALPRLGLINPLFTSAGEHPRAHLGHGVRHSGWLHRRDGARHRNRCGTVVVG